MIYSLLVHMIFPALFIILAWSTVVSDSEHNWSLLSWPLIFCNDQSVTFSHYISLCQSGSFFIRAVPSTCPADTCQTSTTSIQRFVQFPALKMTLPVLNLHVWTAQLRVDQVIIIKACHNFFILSKILHLNTWKYKIKILCFVSIKYLQMLGISCE